MFTCLVGRRNMYLTHLNSFFRPFSHGLIRFPFLCARMKHILFTSPVWSWYMCVAHPSSSFHSVSLPFWFGWIQPPFLHKQAVLCNMATACNNLLGFSSCGVVISISEFKHHNSPCTFVLYHGSWHQFPTSGEWGWGKLRSSWSVLPKLTAPQAWRKSETDRVSISNAGSCLFLFGPRPLVPRS